VATTYELPRTPTEAQIDTILGESLASALAGQGSSSELVKSAAKAMKKLS
jgi:hypothetical protein